MTVVETIYTNQASLDEAKEIVKDRMDVDGAEYANTIDIKNHANKIILDNNFIKINKNFETAYIDSETYQENTIKEMVELLPGYQTDIINEGDTQVNNLNNVYTSNKTKLDTVTNEAKTRLTGIINSSTDGIANTSNPVGFKNGNEVILKDEIIKRGDVYISIPDTAHYANFKSHGASFDSKIYGRVEPHGINKVDSLYGEGSFESPSKNIYGLMLEDEGLYCGQRFDVEGNELFNMTYPNISGVKSIIMYVEKPGTYTGDVLLYEDGEYNIYLKHPVRDLFINQYDNVVIINKVNNKLWINGLLIPNDKYYNKMVLDILPEVIMCDEVKVNSPTTFRKEDLLDIFGKKPIGYDTVTMHPEDGTFSNPEGTCSGQLILEDNNILISKGNLVSGDELQRQFVFMTGSEAPFVKIERCDEQKYYGVVINSDRNITGSFRWYMPISLYNDINLSVEIYVSHRCRVQPRNSGILQYIEPNTWSIVNIPLDNISTYTYLSIRKEDGIYDNLVIKWRYYRQNNSLDIGQRRHLSDIDIYEKKYIKKLYYGKALKVTPIDVKIGGWGGTSFIVNSIADNYEYITSSIGNSTVLGHMTLVTSGPSTIGKRYAYFLKYFKNTGTSRLAISANYPGFIYIDPGETLTNIILYAPYINSSNLQLSVRLATYNSDANVAFQLSKNIQLYEYIDNPYQPYCINGRPETIIDFE